MRKITQVLTFAAVLGFLACSQIGCANAKGVGDEKTSAFSGTQTILYGDPVAVTNAAKSVAEELQLTLVSSSASGLDGKVIARTAKNVKVTVDVKTAGESYSRVTIHAGGFGDRTIQKTYLERIKAKLPAQPEGEAPVAQAPTGKAPAASSPSAQAPAVKAPAATAKPTAEAQTDTAHLPF
jgi:hypothetical protein